MLLLFSNIMALADRSLSNQVLMCSLIVFLFPLAFPENCKDASYYLIFHFSWQMAVP